MDNVIIVYQLNLRIKHFIIPGTMDLSEKSNVIECDSICPAIYWNVSSWINYKGPVAVTQLHWKIVWQQNIKMFVFDAPNVMQNPIIEKSIT